MSGAEQHIDTGIKILMNLPHTEPGTVFTNTSLLSLEKPVKSEDSKLDDNEIDEDLIVIPSRRHRNVIGEKRRKTINGSSLEDSIIQYKQKAEKTIDTVFTKLLRGFVWNQLPCTVIRAQAYIKSLDKKAISSVYEHGKRVFDEELLPSFKKSIIGSKSKAVDQYLAIYDDWKLRIDRLKTMFIILDCPDYIKDSSEIKESITSYWMTALYKGLFEDDSGPVWQSVIDGLGEYFEAYITKHEKIQNDREKLDGFFKVTGILASFNRSTSSHLKNEIVNVIDPKFTEIGNKLSDEWVNVNLSTYMTNLRLLDNRLYRVDTWSKYLPNSKDESMHYDAEIRNHAFQQPYFLKHIVPEILNDMDKNSSSVIYLHNERHCFQDQDAFYKFFGNAIRHSFQELLNRFVGSEHLSSVVQDEKFEDIIRYMDLMSNYVYNIFEHDSQPLRTFSSVTEQIVSSKHAYITKLCNAIEHYIFNNVSTTHINHALNGSTMNTDKVYDHIENVLPLVKDNRHHFDKCCIMNMSKRLLCETHIYPSYINPLRVEGSLIKFFNRNYKLGMTTMDTMRTMIDDVSKSDKLLKAFNDLYHPSFRTAFRCVNKENWKKPPKNHTLKLPKQFQKLADQYKDMFQKEKGNAHLHWIYFLHRVEIDIIFDERIKESCKTIECSIYQATALLAFENHPILTFKQMLKITGMTKEFLKQILASLYAGKNKLLLESEHQTYKINSGFRTKEKWIRMPRTVASTTNIATRHKKDGI